MRTVKCIGLLAVTLPGVLLLMFLTIAHVAAAEEPLSRYDVVWDSPSEDASGSMPLGNGEIGLSAWVEPTGDVVFYISKTDAWGDNGRLLKVGRVRIKLDPAPSMRPFRQTLRLREGMIEVVCGEREDATTIGLWVDANHPVVHVTAQGATPVTATATIELWRTEPYTLPSIEVSDVLKGFTGTNQTRGATIVEPDTLLANQAGRIGWYHHNKKSVGPAITAKIQGLDGFKREDPLLGRTFGAIITADSGERLDDRRLRSPSATSHRFSIHVLTRHPARPREWLEAADRTIAAVSQKSFDQRRSEHQRWWAGFWDRSWINVSTSKTAAPRSLIPTADHPLKIGIDQRGQSRFGGHFGRVSILSGVADDKQVAALAQQPHDRPLATRSGVLFSGLPKAGDVLPDSKAWAFDKGLTIEAWVRSPNGGRIVDKITPGGSDGMLLDMYPGRNDLRLIVGQHQLLKRAALPADAWWHVAATVDNRSGELRLYLNGTVVAAVQIEDDDAFVVSRAYALQRYINACAGRGRYPIKFNGSIFTVPYPGAPGDADYRRWGPGYWWQNTRLPYISMCTSGDFEMMRPLFRMYARDLMPLNKYRTKIQCGHDGVFIPECIYFWGEVFSETYGWTPIERRGKDKIQASGWHKWEWVSGPELVFMMLDYYQHTLDEAFLRETLLPAAYEILTFFDQHYKTNEAGKLVMHPAQALETWWDCTNPMPELAGLRAVTARLLGLPKRLTTPQQRAFWSSFQQKLPELPTREVQGVEALAPAERFAAKRNIENPELYAVFPFRLVSFEKPNVQLGVEALKHRWDRGNSGWRQDDVFMAYLGLADDARNHLAGRAKSRHTGSRFPAFWGPNYDWIPDQDHGGILSKALQAMLLQTEGHRIFLLPAWPEDWNVRFKLHAPYRTTVRCEYRDGRVQELSVSPSQRRTDVILPETLKP